MSTKQDESKARPPGAPSAAPTDPNPPANRSASGVYIRNISRAAIFEFPECAQGARVVIEKGQIGRIDEARVAALADLITPATEAEFQAQQAKARPNPLRR